MSPPAAHISIAGAGPTGALLAILLRRRNIPVTLYERGADPRGTSQAGGRSINLALADRGIHALKLAGIYPDIQDSLIPMRGRMIHDAQGRTSLQPYGQRPNEVIYSISRSRLNELLVTAAIERYGASVHFQHDVEEVNLANGVAYIRDLSCGRMLNIPARPLFAADGAGSAVRESLCAQGIIRARVEPLEHGYKELSIPGGGVPVMEREALHIWPRGNHMLIALPNADGSFTATLFLQRQGAVSFETLHDAEGIQKFLDTDFPDAVQRMPDRLREFQTHPTGFLGTGYAQPWHAGGAVLLMGDAAHAIVPFHGQGMNCCFEDCVELDAQFDSHASWESLFSAFEHARRPNTNAIAAMAVENYLEMRERVADVRFLLQKQVSLELEKRHPRRFIPRYSMVTFHHEISYAMAAERGAIQQDILDRLTRDSSSMGQIDFEAAALEIQARLSPI